MVVLQRLVDLNVTQLILKKLPLLMQIFVLLQTPDPFFLTKYQIYIYQDGSVRL